MPWSRRRPIDFGSPQALALGRQARRRLRLARPGFESSGRVGIEISSQVNEAASLSGSGSGKLPPFQAAVLPHVSRAYSVARRHLRGAQYGQQQSVTTSGRPRSPPSERPDTPAPGVRRRRISHAAADLRLRLDCLCATIKIIELQCSTVKWRMTHGSKHSCPSSH